MKSRALLAASSFVAGVSLAIYGIMTGRIQISDDKKTFVFKSDKG